MYVPNLAECPGLSALPSPANANGPLFLAAVIKEFGFACYTLYEQHVEGSPSGDGKMLFH